MNSVGVAPLAVRGAGLVVVVQGAAALGVAALLVARALAGADQRAVSGYGTAAWFALVGTAVAGSGVALLRGRRAGRGIAVVANLTLLPIAWYLGVGSHRWALGATALVPAAAVLVALFSPSALRWAARLPTPTK